MKQFYLLISSLLAFTAAFSQTNKTTLKFPYSVWSVDASWDNGVPVNGDTIVVPADTKVVVASNETLSDVHLRVYGTVSLIGSSTTVTLDSLSDVVVYDGGKLEKSVANEKIKLNGINIMGGTAGSAVVGPATATGSTSGFQSFILPVKFVGFSVAQASNGILVQWSTSEEHNARSYEVERSQDGNSWSTIASIKAAGNTSTLTNYSFTDKTGVNRTAYYRVRQVDIDGKYVYTATRLIKADSGSTAEVKVASAQNRVVLQFSRQVKDGVLVRFVSLNGAVVSEQKVEQAVGQVILSTRLKGNYVVSVSNGQDVHVARQIIL